MNGIRCHKQNDSPNRNDLSSFLKVVTDVEVERRAGGKLFHARGPATANARSPMDARRVDGTTRSEVDAERSRRRAALATYTVRSDKYPGAAPSVHQHTQLILDALTKPTRTRTRTRTRLTRTSTRITGTSTRTMT